MPASRDARLLLTGVAVDAFGTGLTLPFLVVYLHAVRGLPLATVGLVVGIPAAVALVLLAPIGALVDRVGPRLYIGMLIAGCVVLGVTARRLEQVLSASANGIAAAVTPAAPPRERAARRR